MNLSAVSVGNSEYMNADEVVKSMNKCSASSLNNLYDNSHNNEGIKDIAILTLPEESKNSEYLKMSERTSETTLSRMPHGRRTSFSTCHCIVVWIEVGLLLLLMTDTNADSNAGSEGSCSFPFTYNGQLHYQCTREADGRLGCFMQGRKWMNCGESSDYAVQNKTVSLTIPTFQTPTAVISVNNWIVVQQRIDGTVEFNRNMSEYKAGFGKYFGNFWIGLEKIYQLTNNGQYKLRFELMLTNGTWLSVEYGSFYIDMESERYRIHVTEYSGDIDDVINPADPQRVNNGMPFSAIDRSKGRSSNCANYNQGGWWYKNSSNYYNYKCTAVFVNNNYIDLAFFMVKNGVTKYPLSTARMMIQRT